MGRRSASEKDGARGAGGQMEVEWLAVSGFGFHGSKPSLLYYGQPLTTAGMQRFASRFPI